MAPRLRHLTKTGLISAWLPLATERSAAFMPPPQQPGGFFDRCLANPTQADCLAAILVPCLCIGLLLVGIVIAVVAITRRGKKDKTAAPVIPTTHPAASPPKDQPVAPAGTLVVDKQAAAKPDYIAKFQVAEGPPAQKGMDIVIQQNLVKLGRDPAKADITFYTGMTSSVSSLHCSLRNYRERFYLTDHGSTNGTMLNGEVLEAETPHEVESGDEIVLGDVTMKGVKLIFTREGGAPPPESEGERTVLDDQPFAPDSLLPSGGGAAGSDDDKTQLDSPTEN